MCVCKCISVLACLHERGCLKNIHPLDELHTVYFSTEPACQSPSKSRTIIDDTGNVDFMDTDGFCVIMMTSSLQYLLDHTSNSLDAIFSQRLVPFYSHSPSSLLFLCVVTIQ